MSVTPTFKAESTLVELGSAKFVYDENGWANSDPAYKSKYFRPAKYYDDKLVTKTPKLERAKVYVSKLKKWTK